MNFKSLIAATAIFATASFASAATPITLTVDSTDSNFFAGSFEGTANVNTFSLDLSAYTGLTDIYAQVTANYVGSGYNVTNITFDGIRFDIVKNTDVVNSKGVRSGRDDWEYNFTGVTADIHTIEVTGFAVGGSTVGFTGSVGISNTPFVSVSAVPEPESYALMLAGLGVMGAIARRRNKTKAV